MNVCRSKFIAHLDSCERNTPKMRSSKCGDLKNQFHGLKRHLRAILIDHLQVLIDEVYGRDTEFSDERKTAIQS